MWELRTKLITMMYDVTNKTLLASDLLAELNNNIALSRAMMIRPIIMIGTQVQSEYVA